MKDAIRTCAPRFSMRRMVIDYTDRYYLPAAEQGKRYQEGQWALAKEMVEWQASTGTKWHSVRIELGALPSGTVTVGDPVEIEAKVWLNGNSPSDVVVELVTGAPNGENDLRSPVALTMTQMGEEGDAHLYATTFTPEESGPLRIGARVRPHRQYQITPIEPLIRWA
jgi:starch phosphorylase